MRAFFLLCLAVFALVYVQAESQVNSEVAAADEQDLEITEHHIEKRAAGKGHKQVAHKPKAGKKAAPKNKKAAQKAHKKVQKRNNVNKKARKPAQKKPAVKRNANKHPKNLNKHAKAGKKHH